ncbi:MAG: right-handed parallel beta-helix repeat-containing protein, partial [Candidatus Heimdallarchaeota archaeon]|nr:right-handed parallel beta-helix repeat-containing protein [Candidatus Heimdallarchaeota archaeon]
MNSVNNTFSNINIRNISANKTGIGIYTSTENNIYNNVNISELWGNSSSYGVYILNNNNVTVENCKIENVTSNALACGLYLINSNDVSFTEGNIYNISGSDSYGINTDSSPIFNLSNNVINNCDIGVLIHNSDYGYLIDNVIEETNTFGINISISYHNDIFLNELNHSNYGIYIYDSNYNNVSYNNINGSNSGLYLKSSNTNIILYNHFNNSNQQGFFVWYSDDNQIGHNTILESYYGSFGSCPILYTWDGRDMRLFGDINGPGGLGYRMDKSIYNKGIVNRAPTSTDYTAIDSSYLSPKDGSYIIEIAEDQDEITYLDYAELWVIDHDFGVEIYSPEAALVTCTPYLHPLVLHTVRNSFPPVSAVDRNDEDIKSAIAFADEVYTEAELLTDNVITLDLGDLSEAGQIKLVYRAYTDWSPIGEIKATQYVEVINEFGEWEMVSDDEHFGLPEAMPRTYVIDITGWFKTNDWHVKLHTGEVKVHVDWINIDTS